MRKEERFRAVIAYFLDHRPEAETELVYTDPYELAVSVILSAQCTDKRVNMITPEFFKRFPNAGTLAVARHAEVLQLIKSCSYPNNKSRNLIGMAKTLMDRFNGIMPSEVDQLQTLPGVGRKTAHVLASVLFQKPVLAVDTHVHRVAARIGLTTNAKTPIQTERQLIRHIPEHLIPIAHHWLILHGRYVCRARNPNCPECGLTMICKFHTDTKKHSEE
jgi:endonuclease-3